MPPASYGFSIGRRHNSDRSCSMNMWLSGNMITKPWAAAEAHKSS